MDFPPCFFRNLGTNFLPSFGGITRFDNPSGCCLRIKPQVLLNDEQRLATRLGVEHQPVTGLIYVYDTVRVVFFLLLLKTENQHFLYNLI